MRIARACVVVVFLFATPALRAEVRLGHQSIQDPYLRGFRRGHASGGGEVHDTAENGPVNDPGKGTGYGYSQERP